jgi:2-oxoglutarate ferredoxin oxidoreductase subunit delta
MRAEPSSTLGAMIDLVAVEDCIGCNDCELNCPDFAIYVADKKADGVTFAKLTDEAKARAAAIIENNYRLPENYGK